MVAEKEAHKWALLALGRPHHFVTRVATVGEIVYTDGAPSFSPCATAVFSPGGRVIALEGIGKMVGTYRNIQCFDSLRLTHMHHGLFGECSLHTYAQELYEHHLPCLQPIDRDIPGVVADLERRLFVAADSFGIPVSNLFRMRY